MVKPEKTVFEFGIVPVLSANPSLRDAADVASHGCSKQKHQLVVLKLDYINGGGRHVLWSSLQQLKTLRTGLLNFYPHLLRQKFSGSSSPWPVALLELVSETAFLFTGYFLFKLQVVIGNILQEHRQRRM